MCSARTLTSILVCWVFAGVIPAGHAAQLVVLMPEGIDYPPSYQQWAIDHDHEISIKPVIRLDVLEKKLSEGLFEMNEGRVAEAERRSQQHQESIINAWRTALLIHRYQLDQLPAIIINHHAVFYGLDPRLALDLYQAQEKQ